MANVVEFVTFNLIKGASVADFLLASDKINSGFLAVQKGYISRKLIVQGELWADLVLWETMEDARNAANSIGENFEHYGYFSFIENCDMHHFSVEKSY